MPSPRLLLLCAAVVAAAAMDDATYKKEFERLSLEFGEQAKRQAIKMHLENAGDGGGKMSKKSQKKRKLKAAREMVKMIDMNDDKEITTQEMHMMAVGGDELDDKTKSLLKRMRKHYLADPDNVDRWARIVDREFEGETGAESQSNDDMEWFKWSGFFDTYRLAHDKDGDGIVTPDEMCATLIPDAAGAKAAKAAEFKGKQKAKRQAKRAKRAKDKPIRQDDRGWDIEDDEDEDKEDL